MALAQPNVADARQARRCALATSTVICNATVHNIRPAKLTLSYQCVPSKFESFATPNAQRVTGRAPNYSGIKIRRMDRLFLLFCCLNHASRSGDRI